VAGKKLALRKVRPNIRRQIILMVLAIAGIGIGYGLGFVFKKAPVTPPLAKAIAHAEPTPPGTAPQQVPDQIGTPRVASGLSEKTKTPEKSKIRAYEEALPDNIVETTLAPIALSGPTQPPTPMRQKPEDGSSQEVSPKPLIPTPMQKNRAGTQIGANEESSSNTPLQPSIAPRRTWQRNALPFVTDGRPKIAIVIDDMGVDRNRSEQVVALRPPLTLSYLTYGRDLRHQTAAARKAGHELLMHIPMEPTSTTIDPGPNVLLSGMEETELLQNLRWDMEQFDGYVGINNHMGSRFTSNLKGMMSVMNELNSRGLLFLDSLTSASSKGSKAARIVGIPHLVRNVFLDHVDDLDSIKKRLHDTERLASKNGYAIAIGHPHDNTLAALAPWLATVEERGFQLVPLTALLTSRQQPQAKAN